MKTTLTLFLISIFLLPALAIAQSGDINQDGSWDCLDIDALVDEIVAGTNNPTFDFNGDGIVDAADLEPWLDEAGSMNGVTYLGGDANLDGAVDGSDFIIWNQNSFTFGNGWCGGDFNGDGFTDNADLNILCVNAPPGLCDDPVATQRSRWGAVKADYR